MAPPTNDGTGPTTPPGASTPSGASTPTGSTTSTGSITPTGPTTPTGSTALPESTTLPERITIRRARPKDRYPIAFGNGDAVLHFDAPTGKTEIIANAKILSEASPVFRKLIYEGYDPRDPLPSTEKPRLVQIEDLSLLSGMIALCMVLHGRVDKVIGKNDDGSLTLLSLAQAAKDFQAVEFLKPVISPSLLAPFVSRASECGKVTYQTDADLATAAYLLDQEQLFKLFTRRLVMDHCNQLSNCAEDLFDVIPAKAILQLEEKRSLAKWHIDYFLRKLATHHCKLCKSAMYDCTFLVEIGGKLNPPAFIWPPDYIRHHTIRDVLAAIASLDDFQFFGGGSNEICKEHSEEPWTVEDVHTRCKEIATYVSQQVNGLSFTCLQNVRESNCRRLGCSCQHPDASLHQLDPII